MMYKSKVTRIDVTAGHEAKECCKETAVFFERDIDPVGMRMYYPTLSSWRRLSKAINPLIDNGTWYARSNWSVPGMVLERCKEYAR